MQTNSASPDFLTAELQAHGLHFVVGQRYAKAAPRLEPDELLAELALQQDARLRSALIPLFLQNTQLADSLPSALAGLDAHGQMTLKVYYTAAVMLQDEFVSELQRLVPNWSPIADLYSCELGVDQDASGDVRLYQLGEFHARLTGLAINWPGTYRHAAMRLILRLKQEARWTA
ncbi:MAG: hypothetical protein GY759_21940 [Chloroflexi bacterium]|nr:hypothetical protein [Chloroflexota bacterium]